MFQFRLTVISFLMLPFVSLAQEAPKPSRVFELFDIQKMPTFPGGQQAVKAKFMQEAPDPDLLVYLVDQVSPEKRSQFFKLPPNANPDEVLEIANHIRAYPSHDFWKIFNVVNIE